MNSLVLLAGLAPGVARFIIEENHVKSIRRTINRIPWVVINQHVCSHSGCHLGLADARSVLCKVIAKINLREDARIVCFDPLSRHVLYDVLPRCDDDEVAL